MYKWIVWIEGVYTLLLSVLRIEYIDIWYCGLVDVLLYGLRVVTQYLGGLSCCGSVAIVMMCYLPHSNTHISFIL